MQFMWYLRIERLVRKAARGEEEAGTERRDVLQETDECGLQSGAHGVPPALDVWNIQNTGSGSPRFTENLMYSTGQLSFNKTSLSGILSFCINSACSPGHKPPLRWLN